MPRIYAILAAVCLLLAGGAVVAGPALMNKPIPVSANAEPRMQSAVQPAPDSGVVTCQEMADRANTPGQKPKLSFNDVRAKFQASKDEGIRTAGVKLVDTLEKADKIVKADGPASDSLGAIMAMKVAWMDLQEACAKHGVEVPDLKA